MVKTANNSGDRRGAMGVYSSLVSQKKKLSAAAKKVTNKKSKANLRPLPKEQPARFFAHFRWERIKAYWFSLDGLKRVGKIFAACVLIGIIAVGALFVYYKSQLKEISLSNLSISETVNTYLDRNGEVLWEDTGDADYRLVVDEGEISTYVRQATVALEDRNFYNHPGIDLWGLMRATVSTVTGRGVQGGSTLTQQLIKQVYFADEAFSENRGGISRKIKELILSIELEKMYSKEQIITMYLNESPYGGRRNGIESAAQTYFGKSAKDLTLAESALLAAIPNNPAVLNPYNEYGHESLIARQHKALDVMVEMGYITEDEAKEAKEIAILDQILPESSQYSDMKAPHFVIEVKKLLEKKYGIDMMRTGGYTITTSLDYRAQKYAEEAVATGDAMRNQNNSDNIALVSVDAETAQVIAMVGSIDWNTPIYGEVNATTSLLEPGSTIKPILDYAPLFSLNGDVVYGPGSILKDENIDAQYCNGYTGACQLRNASGQFYGDITIRQSLGSSLNIGAVKALSIVGIDNALEIAHGLGDLSYCENSTAGLSMAIGSGCAVRMVEHANAYASLVRGGMYKELAYVLEVKDRDGKVLESWQDVEGVRVIDEQVAYEIMNILGDADARMTFGGQARSYGFVVPGVWTGSKTGTTTTANSGVAKDSWMSSFSTAIATMVWNGNHDGTGLGSNTNNIVRRVANDYMENVHKYVYAADGKWKSGDQPVRPSGIQTLTVSGKTDIWPSWYSANKSGVIKETVAFNSSNKLRATDCTPDRLRVEIEISKVVDPISGTETWSVPDDYKYEEYDTCTVNTTPDGSAQLLVTRSTGAVDQLIAVIKLSSSSNLGASSNMTYKVYVDGIEYKTGRVTSTVLSNGITYDIKGNESIVKFELLSSTGETLDIATYHDFSSSSSN